MPWVTSPRSSVRCCSRSRCWARRRWPCSVPDAKSKQHPRCRCSPPALAHRRSPSVSTPSGPADGWQISGFPTDVAGARSLLLVADPFTFPVDALLDELARTQPGLAVVGGMASAANAPGDNRLLVDESSSTDGAVGVLLAEDVSPQAVVSQGCRPIGRPYIVTRADGHMIYELGGRPALERLLTTLERLPPGDRHLAEQGLHCGVVIDETKDQFERGDFLIRGVLGVDRATGAVAVGDNPAVGSTVQFQVRDAASADEDLHALLTGRAARGALVFTCNGRGRRLFGTPDHDATLSVTCSAPQPWQGCSVPESSGPSVAATPSTASPPRSPSSRRHHTHHATRANAAEALDVAVPADQSARRRDHPPREPSSDPGRFDHRVVSEAPCGQRLGG